jgi:precorrin-6B C5,15-methyltransferase / cobalt-precorrin-6B C5,C15-methyltransferase
LTIERAKWLSVVGIGEAGLAELSPLARGFVERASLIVGGKRHLAMLDPQQPSMVWSSPIEDSIASILKYRGTPVCILASGDPLWYGIGTTLLRFISIEEMTIIPAPSTFSLACAHLGWSLTEVETLSLCGRSPDFLSGILAPKAKLLVLSAGADTPQIVANLLTQRGYGDSLLTVLAHLGGENASKISGIARSWSKSDVAALNIIAIECNHIDANTTPLNRLPGLPDSAYHHDGQLTKSEVRAITLAALAPMPGELLWDVGAGCGSIGIEWLRSHPQCRAISIEQHSHRLQFIADNMAALGTPHLQLIQGKAPAALQDLPTPAAIFIGGGVTTPGLLATCWTALRSGGRLVANAVTVESELQLLQWHQQFGGTLTRISIQRTQSIGSFLGWKPLIPVTQLVVVKLE